MYAGQSTSDRHDRGSWQPQRLTRKSTLFDTNHNGRRTIGYRFTPQPARLDTRMGQATTERYTAPISIAEIRNPKATESGQPRLLHSGVRRVDLMSISIYSIVGTELHEERAESARCG